MARWARRSAHWNALAAAAPTASCDGPVAVMSFNPHSIAAFGAKAPLVARGLTTSAYAAVDWPLLPAALRDHLRAIPDYHAVGASYDNEYRLAKKVSDEDFESIAINKIKPFELWNYRIIPN